MSTSDENPVQRAPWRLRLPPFRPRPPWWGGDLQTLRNTLSFAAPDFAPFPCERLILPLADGDALWALLNRPGRDGGGPLIVLIHGLTGDESSRNIAASAAYHLGRGSPVLRLNLRGAGPSLGRARGHYHAGRSEDLRQALSALAPHWRERGIVPIGVSLGANMLLKFMSEDPAPYVRAAVAVSAPIDLAAASRAILRPRNAVYHRHLLRAMKRDAARSGDPQIDLHRLAALRTIYAFDDTIVAPTNGFADAPDYYAKSSAAPRLGAIRTPTLLIHAADDPWIPAEPYHAIDWAQMVGAGMVLSPGGGHVGFHAVDHIQPWHDRCAAQFLKSLGLGG